MKLFALVGIMFMTGIPLFAQAEGDDGAEKGKANTPSQRVEPVAIRHVAEIEGYHPLTVAGQTIAAAYLEEKLGNQHGAIVLLPAQGEQIDSYGVIQSIRTRLPDYGWSTLSLDLYYPFKPNIFLATQEDASAAVPTGNASEAQPSATEKQSPASKQAEKNSKNELKENTADAQNKAGVSKDTKTGLSPVSNQARIEAAIAFLKEKNIDRIIFLGHGEGGRIAIKTLDTLKIPVRALILVGTGPLDADIINIFSTFDMPVLDIAGSQEATPILRAAENRRIIMKRHQHKNYIMENVAGADHFFTGLQDNLVMLVRGWLRKYVIERDKK